MSLFWSVIQFSIEEDDKEDIAGIDHLRPPSYDPQPNGQGPEQKTGKLIDNLQWNNSSGAGNWPLPSWQEPGPAKRAEEGQSPGR